MALAQDQGPEPRPAPAEGSPLVTLNTFLAAVSFFYLLYLASQLAYFFSAFGGILPQGFTPAEYARRGFFEMALCAASICSSSWCPWCRIRRDPNVPVLTRVLCLFILLFSLVLSACAASKMSLYIGAFGLTRLRVLTSLFMLCVAVALVCVAVWILAPRFPYMKIAVLAALLVGCWTGWMDVDTQIARYNVNAYLSGRLDTVDVAHLAGLSDGAVPRKPARLLKAEDPQIRAQAREVLADRVLEYYYVTEQNGAVTLQAREEPRLRGWTWTQAQALPLLESLAPELQDELWTQWRFKSCCNPTDQTVRAPLQQLLIAHYLSKFCRSFSKNFCHLRLRARKSLALSSNGAAAPFARAESGSASPRRP